MKLERILEIVNDARMYEDDYDDTFERGFKHGANDAVDNIVAELEKEVALQAEMVQRIEDMPT